MFRRFRLFFEENPLQVAIFAGMTARLLAALFSKGFGMHDDHFLVIEAAGSWVGNYDYNAWLPSSPAYDGPDGHSFFYVGIVYLLLEFFQLTGITDPDTQMLTMRLLHALYSVLVISLGFQIAQRYTSDKVAGNAALLVALFWFMPVLSVRNLVEMVCIPPLMATALFLIDGTRKNQVWQIFVAGLFLGMALGVRYQAALFAVGFGAWLLIERRWAYAVALTFTTTVAFLLTQLPDVFIHGEFLAEFKAYVEYNIRARNDYISSPWYTYMMTVPGLLVPPVSLLLLWGFFRYSRKWLVIVLPVLLFLVFHSMFPNKQERFILPVFPFIMIIGYVGWEKYREVSKFWQNHRKLHRGFWIFFWTLNTIALLVVSTAYLKKSRVESMYYLYQQDDYQSLVFENSLRPNKILPPSFYTGSWGAFEWAVKGTDLEELRETLFRYDPAKRPNYVVFYEKENLEQRVERFEKNVAALEREKEFAPGNLDKLLHWLNHHNKAEYLYVYRIEDANDLTREQAE